MVKLCVFDLDGTLLDTIHDIKRITDEQLIKYNYKIPTVEDYKNFVGNGFKKMVERVCGDDLKKKANTIYEDASKIYKKNTHEKTLVYDGVYECLEYLKSNNIDVVINTNKPHDATIGCVDKFLSNYFDEYYGVKDESLKKPNPSLTNRIIKEHNVKKEEVLFIGDSVVDIETANNAQIRSIACLWGYQPKKRLIKYSPTYIALKPLDIIEIIKVINDGEIYNG